ncbi:MAG TPA: hypothetical protein PKA55_02505 [Rhodoblastus sp.]|nr:hypothetical protein [Rhodoblastus sp.]
MSEPEEKSIRIAWLVRPSPKVAAIVIGFVLSIIGAAGQFFYVDAIAGKVDGKNDEIRRIDARVSTLRETQVQYFNAQVQSSTLFALDPADETRQRGVVAKLYQLNLLDKAFPFRALMAEMAIAGLFEFKPVNDAYRALNEAARADLTFENFQKLNAFEREILDRALDLQHKLQERRLVVAQEAASLAAERDRRKLTLVLLSSLGACFLLVANLLSERRPKATDPA